MISVHVKVKVTAHAMMTARTSKGQYRLVSGLKAHEVFQMYLRGWASQLVKVVHLSSSA